MSCYWSPILIHLGYVPWFQTWCMIWWYWLLCPPPWLYRHHPLCCHYAGLVVNETCNLLSWVALCSSTVFCIPFEHFIYIPFPLHSPLQPVTRISSLFSSFSFLKNCKRKSALTTVGEAAQNFESLSFFISGTKRKVNAIRIRSTWKERETFLTLRPRPRLHYYVL